MSISVALVLDSNFGEKIELLAKQMPVWIVASQVNEKFVNSARLNLDCKQITILKCIAGESEFDTLYRALYTIDEHHGEVSSKFPYDTLSIYGSHKSIPQEVALELGFNNVIATNEGCKATK